MKKPWVAVGGGEKGHWLNWGYSYDTQNENGTPTHVSRTTSGIGFREIALITIGTGILLKVALSFAPGLLGM